MRIISGKYRGRRLLGPSAKSSIRPTRDQVREMCFNILAHSPWPITETTRVLDAFAGTGLWGLEALSRGAAQVIFMDIAPEALTLIYRNAQTLGVEQSCRILRMDAIHPAPALESVHLVFLDPPYGHSLITPAIQGLSQAGWFQKDTIVVLEHAHEIKEELPPFLEVWKCRDIGQTQVVFTRILGEKLYK